MNFKTYFVCCSVRDEVDGRAVPTRLTTAASDLMIMFSQYLLSVRLQQRFIGMMSNKSQEA